MLNRIEARTNDGDILPLALGEVTNGIVIKGIEGLDPGKLMDGEPRQIILKLGMEPEYATGGDIQSLRKLLYGYFMPEEEVNLRFYTSETSFVEIDGVIETFEAPLFVQEPEATISVLCEDPMFYNPIWAEITGATKTDNSPETLISNKGSVESGFILQVYPDRAMTSFSFLHRSRTNQILEMEFNASMQQGDVVTISTVPGEKGATILRGGQETSYLRAVPSYAPWILVPKGVSYFTVFAPNAVGVPFVLSYQERHGGL